MLLNGIIMPTTGHSFKGISSPPGVAAVNDGVGSSVVCVGDFCREDGRREMTGDLEAGYYRGRN